MTPTEAYILGVLLGDGSVSLYKRNYVISLTVSSQVFAGRFASALRAFGKNPWEGMVRNGKMREYFRVQTYSKVLYLLAKPRIVPQLSDAAAIEFVRGFYESEGHNRGHGRGLEFYNTEPYLLRVVASILDRSGISSKLRLRRKVDPEGYKRMWYLAISARDKHLFMGTYTPCIKI